MTIDIYNPEKKTTNLEEGRKWEVERYKKEGQKKKKQLFKSTVIPKRKQ